MTEETGSVRLDSVERAIEDIRNGKPIVVVDNEDRENEGDLIFAAEKATPELVAFMIRYSSGYICVAMTDEDADRLGLPPMVAHNQDRRQTAYTITVDADNGSTGISARNRCETIRRLGTPDTTAAQLIRPGHINPLRARTGGVLVRDGHTEASVDLARLAGLHPAGALCELVSQTDPTDMARGPELRNFADEHDLAMISIAQLAAYIRQTQLQITLDAPTRLPTAYGQFSAYGVRSDLDGTEHVALVCGDVRGQRNVLVRVHSECLTGDVFGSFRCDCGPQLQRSLAAVQEAGSGVVIYLRGHEGRGIGLRAKLRAYQLQDEGLDTIDANLEQGLPVDAREYSVAGQILRELGVVSARILTNNPTKHELLRGFGPKIVGRQPLLIDPNVHNIAYLKTKRDRMGHDLPMLAEWEAHHAVSDHAQESEN